MSRGGRGGGGFGRGRGRGTQNMFGMPWDEFRNVPKAPTDKPQFGIWSDNDVIDYRRPSNQHEVDRYRAGISLRQRLKSSAFYIRPMAPKRDIEKYSDRYLDNKEKSLRSLHLNPEFFPEELRDYIIVTEKMREAAIQRRNQSNGLSKDIDKEAVLKALETTDKTNDDDILKDAEPEEEQPSDFEDDEGDNDYEQEYFDNGEGEDDADEGGMEGDTY